MDDNTGVNAAILERLENSRLIHSFIDHDGQKRYAKGDKNLLSNKLLSYDDVYLDPLGVGHYDLYDS